MYVTPSSCPKEVLGFVKEAENGNKLTGNYKSECCSGNKSLYS